MRHNKYICENPVSVSVDGDTYTFTLNDCRYTSPQVIQHVLNTYAKNYLCEQGLYSRAPKTSCGNLLLTTSGKVATISVPGVVDQRTLAEKIQAGAIDGVYIDFVNDLAWVNDSATPANNFTGTASTLLGKAYTPSADGALINGGSGGFVLTRAKHNWDATKGTYVVGHKSSNLAQTNTSLLSHNIRFPMRITVLDTVSNIGSGYRFADQTNSPYLFQHSNNLKRQVLGLSYGGLGCRSSLNGSDIVANAFHGSWESQELGIGARPQDGVGKLEGWIDSVVYTPEQISDSELKRNTGVGTPTYDVFLIAGQSNAVGRALWSASSGSYVVDARQFLQTGSVALPGPWNQVWQGTSGILDLDHVDDGRNDDADSFGLAMRFGQSYSYNEITEQNKRVLFVSCATGGTGFAANNWNPGDTEYEYAIERINAALALPNTTLKGILWHQGERDVFDGNVAGYEAALDAMIAAMRSDITGGSSCPFVLGGMLPAYIASPTGGGTAVDAAAIQAIIEDTPNRVSNCAYAANTGLTGADGIHFDAASILTLGDRYYTAWATI